MHRVGQNICKCTETKTSKNIPCCCYAVALFHFHLSSRVIKETDEKNCTLNHLCKLRLWSRAAVHALLCVWNSFPGWKRRVSQDKQEHFSASMFPNWASVCETNNNNNNNQCFFLLLPIKQGTLDGRAALFWKSLRDPRAQTFHWNPHPCAFTPAHACQRPVFMERGESQCPPVVSLHSAKKFQFLSSFTTRTAAFLYGTATKAPRMSENENQ